jgi:sigma-B regulation protein RsbU (phosphoserine phosphatase)
MSAPRPRVLVADDEAPIRAALRRILTPAGYDCVMAEDGMEAWEAIDADAQGFDAIVLDRHMPRMDGIEVLTRLKAEPRLRGVPVVMQTAARSIADTISGLRAGAYYYLAKPYDPGLLLAVVAVAIAEHDVSRALQEEARANGALAPLLRAGEFEIRTIRESRLLATLLAGAFPDAERVVVGLTELLVNAVEHGNLGITYAEKSALLEGGGLEVEIDRRLARPELAGRRARVTFRRHADRITTVIADEGRGFDWRAFVDYDPARAFDLHGRGIAIARGMSFDHVSYDEVGSTVTAEIHLATRPSEAERPAVYPPFTPLVPA